MTYVIIVGPYNIRLCPHWVPNSLEGSAYERSTLSESLHNIGLPYQAAASLYVLALFLGHSLPGSIQVMLIM
jgi:hypothetical protein